MSPIETILSIFAGIGALWDLGRRFAARPTAEHKSAMEQALARLKAAEERLAEHAAALATHSEKLTTKALKDIQPLDRPRIRR